MLQKHEGVKKARSIIVTRIRAHKFAPDNVRYSLAGKEGAAKYIRDYSGLVTFGHAGNLAVTYLGSYNIKYYIVNVDDETGTAEVLFHVSNSSTPASGFRPYVLGYAEFWQTKVDPYVNEHFQSGPMSKTTQNFWWTETVSFRR
jgi:hypothetical protein